MITEFEQIVEFCYNCKEELFVVRFLNGESYTISVSNLPKKLQTKKPQWEHATLSTDKKSILVTAGNDMRQIAAHIIHARGVQL